MSCLVVILPSHVSGVLTFKLTIKESKPHAHTHHVVIIVIIIIIAMLYFVLFHKITCYINSLLSLIYTTPLYHMHFGCHKHDITEFRVFDACSPVTTLEDEFKAHDKCSIQLARIPINKLYSHCILTYQEDNLRDGRHRSSQMWWEFYFWVFKK